MTPPPGHRAARVVARDIRPWDLLAVGDRWHEVTCVSPTGPNGPAGDIINVAAGQLQILAYRADAPVLVCWRVPRTTVGLAEELRR